MKTSKQKTSWFAAIQQWTRRHSSGASTKRRNYSSKPATDYVVLARNSVARVEIAQAHRGFIHQSGKINVETGVIDVAMHRDDVVNALELPLVHESKLTTATGERTVIVVDDVIYTGRTVPAAWTPSNNSRRPARSQWPVLIDRRPSRSCRFAGITSERFATSGQRTG